MTEPVNHLAEKSGIVVEILQSFTDEQLMEQSAWFQQERARYLSEPDDGKPYGNRYAAYRMSVTDSSVHSELRRRHRTS